MTPPEQPLKALVVDDSALFRKIVREVLQQIPGVEVVGTAANGRAALERIVDDRPDFITLDLEMPELDGLGLLRELAVRDLDVKAVMISSQTSTGAQATSAALQLGAFDFVLKPHAAQPAANAEQLRRQLEPKVAAIASTIGHRRVRIEPPQPAPPPRPAERAGKFATPKIVGIGVSTGGPAALSRILPRIPGDFPCPIVVVQHMPPMFTKSLAEDLNRSCRLEVLEAYDGCVAVPGKIFIAPGGKQMRVSMLTGRPVIQITDDPPERHCKPSVDYLFRSLASHFGPEALGVILTGMGDDGTIGCRHLRERGARIIAQDQATCVVYGMPKSVFEAGLVDQVEPLDRIVPSLVSAATVEAAV